MLIAAEIWSSDIDESSGVERSVLEEEEGVIGDILSWSIESWSTRYWDWMERSCDDKDGDEDTDDVKETGLDFCSGEEEELIARTASGLTMEQNALNLEVGMAEAGTSYLRRTSKRAEVGLLSIVMSSRLRVARLVVLELEEESDESDLVSGFGDDEGDWMAGDGRSCLVMVVELSVGLLLVTGLVFVIDLEIEFAIDSLTLAALALFLFFEVEGGIWML